MANEAGLNIYPCLVELTNQKNNRFPIVRKDKDGNDVILPECSVTDRFATEDPRCTLDGQLNYIKSTDDLSCAQPDSGYDFWSIFNVVTIDHKDLQSDITIMTSHPKRIREIMKRDKHKNKYCKGQVLHITGNRVKEIYTKCGRNYKGGTLPFSLNTGKHVFVICNENEKEKEKLTELTKFQRVKRFFTNNPDDPDDQHLSTESILLAEEIGRAIEKEITSINREEEIDNEVRFMASTLRRSQQTTLIVYRTLRDAGLVKRSETLDTLYNNLIQSVY